MKRLPFNFIDEIVTIELKIQSQISHSTHVKRIVSENKESSPHSVRGIFKWSVINICSCM